MENNIRWNIRDVSGEFSTLVKIYKNRMYEEKMGIDKENVYYSYIWNAMAN